MTSRVSQFVECALRKSDPFGFLVTFSSRHSRSFSDIISNEQSYRNIDEGRMRKVARDYTPNDIHDYTQNCEDLRNTNAGDD